MVTGSWVVAARCLATSASSAEKEEMARRRAPPARAALMTLSIRACSTWGGSLAICAGVAGHAGGQYTVMCIHEGFDGGECLRAPRLHAWNTDQPQGSRATGFVQIADSEGVNQELQETRCDARTALLCEGYRLLEPALEGLWMDPGILLSRSERRQQGI